jgi:hypothetical protein
MPCHALAMPCHVCEHHAEETDETSSGSFSSATKLKQI